LLVDGACGSDVSGTGRIAPPPLLDAGPWAAPPDIRAGRVRRARAECEICWAADDDVVVTGLHRAGKIEVRRLRPAASAGRMTTSAMCVLPAERARLGGGSLASRTKWRHGPLPRAPPMAL